jgi:hypothetical protein
MYGILLVEASEQDDPLQLTYALLRNFPTPRHKTTFAVAHKASLPSEEYS